MKAIAKFFALALLLAALPAAAQTYDWSAVGSVGGIDTASNFFKAGVVGGTLQFASTQTVSFIARYPVTNTYGTSIGSIPGWTTLRAAYTDNSSLGSVTVTLFKLEKCSGTTTQLCSISSSDDPALQCTSCSFSSGDVDFANNIYWIEVTLARSSTAATEQIHNIALN